MRKVFKHLYNSIITLRNEENRLIQFIDSLDLHVNSRILDVGCGYGKYLKKLSFKGYEVTGVDCNEKIVEANKKAGLNCTLESDFTGRSESYDVVLMSHIIEHFYPEKLLEFLGKYLDCLKDDGFLIIATPLITPHFYIDFDHIRPYYPTGINMVFGNKFDQVQYYSKSKLQLVDIWFRRSPFRLYFLKGLYVGKYNKILPEFLNMILIILFRCSLGLIGRTTGWIGLYQKLQHESES